LGSSMCKFFFGGGDYIFCSDMQSKKGIFKTCEKSFRGTSKCMFISLDSAFVYA
jgi:hypothetical protein